MSDFWIQTRKGIDFDLLEPAPEMIDVEDIAHSLAQTNRYVGHTEVPYSVAEHSVRVSWRCWTLAAPAEKDVAGLWGLLHDASEAYTGDASSPLKRAMRAEVRAVDAAMFSPFDVIERRIQAAIVSKFGLPPLEPAVVKRADLELLSTEKRDLRQGPQTERTWHLTHEPLADTIRPWDAAFAEQKFLDHFRSLNEALLRR